MCPAYTDHSRMKEAQQDQWVCSPRVLRCLTLYNFLMCASAALIYKQFRKNKQEF